MDDLKKLEFLKAVAKIGDGANMWSVGSKVGLERGAIESLSVELMGLGYLEVASLSGGVRLTDRGKAELAGAEEAEKAPDLESLIDLIALAGLDLGPTVNANLKADLATLKAGLGRKPPLLPVLKSCLAAIDGTLQAAGPRGAKLHEQLTVLKPQ